MSRYDAIVVGAGPNGLAAAIRLAQAGLAVLVREARDAPGGGATTEELTLPGYLHDHCSSVHPLGIGSPFFRQLPLAGHGLHWVHPETPLAHPLGDDAVALEVDLHATARSLGEDGDAWVDLFGPFVDRADDLLADALGPLRWPSDPLLMARFGRSGLRSAAGLAGSTFNGERANALFGGCAAHSIAPLERSPTAAFGLMLVICGHARGWPFARGGSRALTGALVAHLNSLGGVVECGSPVQSLDDLPTAPIVLLDLTPKRVVEVAGTHLRPGYRRALQRYRYGPGVFKIDWALAGPIPWRAKACRRAGTIHIGGSMAAIRAAERAVSAGQYAERPFILAAQPSVFDDTRAPAGQHTAWAYCHVPNGSNRNLTQVIEKEIEGYAPGFGDLVLGRSIMTASEFEGRNPNFVGGDIGGGAMTLSQLFFRPTVGSNPYRTSRRGLYICSSATPPGGGVHGMCGFHAAQTALRDFEQGNA